MAEVTQNTGRNQQILEQILYRKRTLQYFQGEEYSKVRRFPQPSLQLVWKGKWGIFKIVKADRRVQQRRFL